MTLGTVLTLGAAVSGLFAAFSHWRQLRALPTRTDPAYDETVEGRALVYKLVIAVGLALPFIANGAFRLIDPDLFGMKLL